MLKIPVLYIVKVLGALLIAFFIAIAIEINNGFIIYGIALTIFAATYDNKDIKPLT